MVNLGRYHGSCNTLDDISGRIYVPNKTEGANLSVLNMITETNESKTLSKHISCECKCIFDGRKYNSDQKWNKDKCRCKHPEECHVCGKYYISNPTTCTCKND